MNDDVVMSSRRKRSLSWGSTDAEKIALMGVWKSMKEKAASPAASPISARRKNNTTKKEEGKREDRSWKWRRMSPSTEDRGNESGNEGERYSEDDDEEDEEEEEERWGLYADIPAEYRIGDYLLVEQLGTGSGGSVYRGRHLWTGEQVAIKVMDTRINRANNNNSNSDEEKPIHPATRGRREASIMAALNGHKRIVRLLGVEEEQERLAIIMQLGEGGDLLEHILLEKRKRSRMGLGPGGLSRNEAYRIFSQLVEALSFAHSSGFVHRDIKPENIFLDREGNVLLGDWGYGTAWHSFKPKTKSCGSLNYVAPELLRRDEYIGPEVDIYALGVVLFAMLTGSLPFGSSTDRKERLLRVLRGDWGSNNPHLTAAEARLLDRMFERDVLKRATMYDIVEYLKQREKGLPPRVLLRKQSC